MKLRKDFNILRRIFKEKFDKEVRKVKNVKELHAVHEGDLVEYLRSLGILEDVTEGNVTCSICGKKIGLDNIQCIYPEKEEIKISCNSFHCYLKILEEQGGIAID